MKILAIEFSSPQRSVAALNADASAPPARALAETVESVQDSKRALSMADEVLCRTAMDRSQVDCLAVGIGPGSYTGIRAAIALAQGWQLAAGEDRLRLLGISSADCIAAQAAAEGLTGNIHVIIDAQRGEFYMAGYELGNGFRSTDSLRLATRSEVEQRAGGGGQLIGPEVTRWFGQGRIVFPRASMLASLALGREDFVSGEKLEPIYLRETAFVKAPPPKVY